MFRLPYSLVPLIVPTAVAALCVVILTPYDLLFYNTRYKAAGTYTPRNGRVVTQHELWYHYASESSN